MQAMKIDHRSYPCLFSFSCFTNITIVSLAFTLTIYYLAGVDAPSGVPDQPMGDEQTQEGAVNRAKAAYAQYAQEHSHNPDFAVGILLRDTQVYIPYLTFLPSLIQP